MRAACIGLISVMAWAATPSAASASAIQVNVWGEVDNHNIDQSVTLSDPSQAVTIGPFSQMLIPTSGPNGYTGGGTIDSPFTLNISAGTPGSSSAFDTVTITGEIQGSYGVVSPANPNMDGSVGGGGTAATLSVAPGTSTADVPPYLADLLNHPGRVGYSGGILPGTMSGANILQTALSIAPPVDPNAMVPAPEPSMVWVAVICLSSLPLARVLRRR